MEGTGTPIDETVGQHYFTIAELREMDSALAANARVPVSDKKLEEARDSAERTFEIATARAFVPREKTERLHGSGRRALLVDTMFLRSVTSVSVDGVALTAPELAALTVWSHGEIERSSVWPKESVIEVVYEHGYDEAPPEVKRAALILAKEYAMPSTGLSSRATAQTIGDQTFRITVAGRDGRTGIPDVDAVMADYPRRTVVG